MSIARCDPTKLDAHKNGTSKCATTSKIRHAEIEIQNHSRGTLPVDGRENLSQGGLVLKETSDEDPLNCYSHGT